jgi:hypothetical protein
MHSLTSALDGGEYSPSHPGHFTHRERAPPSTQWVGGWVGPRAGLDTVVKRKIPSSCQTQNSNTPHHDMTKIHSNLVPHRNNFLLEEPSCSLVLGYKKDTYCAKVHITVDYHMAGTVKSKFQTTMMYVNPNYSSQSIHKLYKLWLRTHNTTNYKSIINGLKLVQRICNTYTYN